MGINTEQLKDNGYLRMFQFGLTDILRVNQSEKCCHFNSIWIRKITQVWQIKLKQANVYSIFSIQNSPFLASLVLILRILLIY